MLEEQITKDYIQAMKDKDKVKSSTLSFLRAQLKNVVINTKAEKLEDKEVVVVIKKQVKQRQDSIEQFEKGDRGDLADKEKAELAILKSYLPEEMSAEAVKPLVDEAIKESEASGMKDMGKVMKALLPKVAGKADNKLVSEIVRTTLSQM